MRIHSVNYLRDVDAAARAWVNRGFYWDNVPRVVWRCRLFGHKPVVAGFGDPADPPGRAVRWVECDRCGVRPDPQGDLDPERWAPGDRYHGVGSAWRPALPEHPSEAAAAVSELKACGFYPPGPWPGKPRTGVSAHLLLWCWEPVERGTWGVMFEVGGLDSENALKLSVHIGPLLQLRLLSGAWGTWWQRRLNPGPNGRTISVDTFDRHLYWRLWVPRSPFGGRFPKWRDGVIPIGIRDVLLGRKRYEYAEIDTFWLERHVAVSDDWHGVQLRLRHETFGRHRWWKRRRWVVEWQAREMIRVAPRKQGKRGMRCGTVTMPDTAVAAGTWPDVAVAQIAVEIAAERTRRGWAGTGTRVDKPASRWRKPEGGGRAG